MIIDTDDMNKENIDEENIGVLDGTPLILETDHYVVPRPLSDFYKSLHQKHISKPHKEFLDIDALTEFRNNNEDYCNEENSDKLLKERFGTKGAAIEAYIKNHDQPKLYKKGKDRDDILGRDFCPTNAISIPRVAREVAISDYDDLDCDASHPTCLISLCRRRKVKIPAILKRYVRCKDEVREIVKDQCQITMRKAKELLQICTYLGWDEVQDYLPQSPFLSVSRIRLHSNAGFCTLLSI